MIPAAMGDHRLVVIREVRLMVSELMRGNENADTLTISRLPRLPGCQGCQTGVWGVSGNVGSLGSLLENQGFSDKQGCQIPTPRVGALARCVRNRVLRRFAADQLLNSPFRLARWAWSRATMLECIWLTRDSLRLSVAPISFIVISS